MIGTAFAVSRLGFAFVSGTDAFADAMARFLVKLALRSRHVDTAAGDEMVALMQSRVPVDSGRLFNGITSEVDEDGSITVQASAVRPGPRGDFDYARSVEFGHDTRHVADAGYFESGARRPHRRSRATTGGHVEAEPFFLGSAEEVLEERGQSLDDAITEAAGDAGL